MQSCEVLIYNTTDDPFDMYPLNDIVSLDVIMELKEQLPNGFCHDGYDFDYIE
jgi:hypothetical protein